MMRNGIIVCTFLLLSLLLCMLTACKGSDSQLDAIRDRGELRVGVKVDVPRFGYMNPDTGEMEGMEVDLARAIAEDIIGDADAVKFVNITAQTRGVMLDNGEIDLVIATFTITEERKLSFNFSRPYYTDELGYLVRIDSDVNHPEDLDGKSVGVTQASTAKAAFEEEYSRLGIDVTLLEYASYPEVKEALAIGEVEAFIADKSILYGYLDDECLLLGDGFNPQQYGIASKLENDQLAGHIDAFVETMESDGGLSAILGKWGL